MKKGFVNSAAFHVWPSDLEFASHLNLPMRKIKNKTAGVLSFFLSFCFSCWHFPCPLTSLFFFAFLHFSFDFSLRKHHANFYNIVQPLDQLQQLNEGGWQYVHLMPRLFLLRQHLFAINRYCCYCGAIQICQCCFSGHREVFLMVATLGLKVK